MISIKKASRTGNHRPSLKAGRLGALNGGTCGWRDCCEQTTGTFCAPAITRSLKIPSKGRVTQYEQAHLEELGLIKFDFLGLSNLTILDNAVKFIKAIT